MTESETLSSLMERVVRGSLPELDCYAFYAAEVLSQNADGTLELRPDDERRPPLSNVPIYHALPGQEVKVAAGARVFFHFVAGDRRKPIVTHWERQGLQEHSTEAAVKLTAEAPTIELSGTTINVNGSAVRLGGVAATDYLLKGTIYRVAEATKHSSVVAAAAAAATAATVASAAYAAAQAIPTPPPTAVDTAHLNADIALAGALAAFFTALSTALTTFEAGSLPFLSTVSRTE